MPDTAAVTRRSSAKRGVEQARATLAGAHGDHVPRLGERERFAFDTSSGSLLEGIDEPFEDVLVVATLRGGALTMGNGDHEPTTSGGMVWFPPGGAQRVRVDDVVTIARLDMTALGHVAHEMSGIAPDTLHFHTGPPVSEARVRYWESTRRWVAEHVLVDDAVATEPLVRAEAFRALARATLLVVPNTALDRLTDPAALPGRAEPATVRRAVEFMDANAGRDIGISQIAAAARIGARGLQAAFRRHRGQTPLEYLRQVRMDGAHHDLQAADPTRGDTVAAIAARWGFTHPGRFSVEYGRTHGCPPSDTLRH